MQAEDAAEAAALADEADMPLEQLLAAYGYALPASGGDGKPPGGGGGCEAAGSAEPADGKAAALTAEAGPTGMATAAAGSAEANDAEDDGAAVMDVNGSPSPVRHSLRSTVAVVAWELFNWHSAQRRLASRFRIGRQTPNSVSTSFHATFLVRQTSTRALHSHSAQQPRDTALRRRRCGAASVADRCD